MNDCGEESKLSLSVFLKYHKNIFKHFISPISIVEHMTCLDDEVCDDIHAAADNPSQQVKILFNALLHCTDDGALQMFLDAVNAVEDHKWLYPLFVESTSPTELQEILNYVDKIESIKKLWSLLKPHLHHIHVDECVDILSPWLADHEKEYLIQKYNNYGNSITLWWMIRILTRKEKTWVHEFYNFVQERGYVTYNNGESVPITRIILEFFDYDPLLFHKEQIQLSSDCGAHSPHPDVDTQNPVRGDNNIALNIREFVGSNDDRNLKESNIADSSNHSTNLTTVLTQMNDLSLSTNEKSHNVTTSVDTSSARNGVLVLREYQKELAEPAVDGKNVIICAPPGSGKTHVAAHVMKSFLETRNNSQKIVLYFTPSGGLAQQQHQRLVKYLPEEFHVDLCFGQSEHSSLDLLKYSSVVVLTPQILLNSLKDKSKKDMVSTLNRYGLFIFDECHHCMKEHAYNGVMRQYFNLKHKQSASVDLQLPQVVGMTATMGIGKKCAEANQEILQLCSNLDAIDGIVTVRIRKNVEELKKHIPQPEEENIALPQRMPDPFYRKLIWLMRELFKELNRLTNDDHKPPSYEDIDDNTDAFVQWCVNLKKDMALSSESDLGRNIISCLEYLELCAAAKEMHLKCRAIDAVNQMERYKHLKDPVKFTEMEKNLYGLFEETIPEMQILARLRECENPNLEEMQKIILKTFDENRDSIGMVMVQKQIYTKAIKDWMNETKELQFLNVEIFIGTRNRKDAVANFNLNQQLQVMKDFASKNHKMLICTPDAAGEGMDFAECSLVVDYDFLKNEVTTTQIKGRVRKHGGKVYQMSSYKVADRDRRNVKRKAVMINAINVIQKFFEQDFEKYLKTIGVLQDESRIAYNAKMMAQLAVRPREPGKEYLLQCFKCNMDVCSSFDIRRVEGNQHTNPTPEFKDKCVLMEHPRKKPMGPDWEKLHKVVCKKCSYDWGIEAIWKDSITLPLIKIEGFRLKEVNVVNPKVYVPRKWKHVPFVLIEASLQDLVSQMLQYSSGDDNGDDDGDDVVNGES